MTLQEEKLLSLHSQGWSQGSVFRANRLLPEQRARLLSTRARQEYRDQDSRYKLRDDHLLALVTQDCDIFCALSHEPLVELVVFEPEKRPYHLNQVARSTRTLDIEINQTSYRANVWKICYAPKNLVSELGAPCFQLDETQVKILITWRANRYLRTALPHSFNVAFDQAVSPHKDFLQLSREHVVDLFVKLNSYKEGLAEYQYQLMALVKDSLDPEPLFKIQDCMDEIVRVIDSFDGLISNESLSEPELVSLVTRWDEITVAALSRFKPIYLEYLSFGDAQEEENEQ